MIWKNLLYGLVARNSICGKGIVDDIAGSKFTTTINSYQKNVLGYNNLDGEVTAGKKMWKSLLGMV